MARLRTEETRQLTFRPYLRQGWLWLPPEVGQSFFRDIERGDDWGPQHAWFAYGNPKYPSHLFLKPTAAQASYSGLRNYVVCGPRGLFHLYQLEDLPISYADANVYPYASLLELVFDPGFSIAANILTEHKQRGKQKDYPREPIGSPLKAFCGGYGKENPW